MDLSFAEPQSNLQDDENDENETVFPPRPLEADSLDSSIILQQHYEALEVQKEMEAKMWVFPESAVDFDDTDKKLLGQGTFGEVYVAKWRHVSIACKCLHQSQQSQLITVAGTLGDNINEKVASIKAQKESMLHRKIHLKELEVLTKLRHPNLVLFLGICHSISDKTEPTMILSELMDYSLYELLETKKVVLDVPEMLEILSDVMCGLGFLHSQNPPVIHRNLTSKNILFKGSVARIGDFGITGQGLMHEFRPVIWTNSAGKTVVGSVMKGQEEAPQQWARAARTPPHTSEAVAYLAPEVLNGTKYELSDRMDIYSVGVLLLHMVSCTYPSLEIRQQQLEELTAKQPVFTSLTKNLLEELPSERMDAQGVMAVLNKIMFNDRYYPLARRRPSPQSEVSILARRWMSDEAKNENQISLKRLRQMTELLKAEGSRWQKEGALGQYLQEQLEATNKELTETTEKYLAQTEVLTVTAAKLASTELDLKSFIQNSDKKTKSLLAERHHLAERVMDLEMHYRQNAKDLSEADAVIKNLSQQLATRDNSIINLKAKERTDSAERRHLTEEIHALTEEKEDLEVRLEQALQRWKMETEVSATCRADFVKLRQTCTTLLSKNERLEQEKKTLSDLVKEQESSVLPEEVMRKIQKLEEDLVNATVAAEALVEQKASLQSQLSDMQKSRDDYSKQLEEALAVIKDKKAVIAERDSAIADLKAQAADTEVENTAITDDLREKQAVADMKISKLEEWIKSLEKGVLPAGYKAQGPHPESESVNKDIAESKGTDPLEKKEEEEEDMLSVLPRDAQQTEKRVFHMGDLAHAVKLTTERKNLLKAQDAGKAEKMRQAAIRAADSMAKARVVGFERAEDGTGAGCLGLIKMLRDSVQDAHICWRACRALRPIILNDKTDKQIIRKICIENELDLICVNVMKR